MDKNRARITIKLNQPKEGQAPKKFERPVVNPEPKVQSESWEEQEMISDVEQAKPVLVPQPNTQPEPESKFEPEPEPEPKEFIARDEVAAGDETMDKRKRERFIPDWDVLEEKDHSLSTNRRSYKSRFRNSRENQTKGVLAVAVSVIGAIVLGLVFGFVVLGFFKSGLLDSPSAPSAAVPKVQEGPSAGSQVEPSSEGNASTEGQAPANSEVQDAITTVSITLPSNTWYVIQGGVFQDEGSAGPILEKIKSKGWPNHFVGDKPLHLLLGLAAEREHVLALAAPYKEMDVYIKEWSEETKTVSVAVKQGAETTQEEWDQWFDREEEMVQVLGQAIAEGVTTRKLAEGSMKQVKDAHRGILQQGRELISKLPQEHQSLGNRMLNDFSKGVSALERYQKQPTEGYLWQAEQAILDSYKSKQTFFSSFQ